MCVSGGGGGGDSKRIKGFYKQQENVEGRGGRKEILVKLRVLQTAKQKMQRREGEDFGTV